MRGQLKIVGCQAILVLMVAIIVSIVGFDHFNLLGVLYGGFISITVSVVILLRVSQATRKVVQGDRRGLMYVYLGAMERLLVSMVLFGLGFMWLKLMPLPIVMGLIAGQIGFSIGGAITKE